MGTIMHEARIRITPPPTTLDGPRLDSLTSILVSKKMAPHYQDNKPDITIVWAQENGKTILDLTYGKLAATATINLGPPPKLSIELQEEKQTLSTHLKEECTDIDFQTLMGQTAAIGVLLLTGVITSPEAQNILKDIAKYTLPNNQGKCKPPAAYPLDLNFFLKEAVNEVRNAADAVIELSRDLIREKLVPQVGINIVYSPPPPYHISPSNHVALPTRIVATSQGLTYSTEPKPGASRHLSRALLVYMEYYPDTLSVMNLAYNPSFIEKARRRGLRVSSYDRSEEPPEVKKREGGTMPWGVRRALEKCVEKPHIIYHKGDWGKEPMINLFAPSPRRLVEILRTLL